MATTKPRVTVTFEAYAYEVLKAMSASSGQTMSSIISGLIDVSLPVLVRMTETYQLVKKSGEYQRTQMVETMQEAQDLFEPLVMNGLHQRDLFNRRTTADVIEASRRDDRASAAAPSTPTTNRGVTTLKPTPPNTNRGKALKPVSKKEVLKKVAVSNGHKSRAKS